MAVAPTSQVTLGNLVGSGTGTATGATATTLSDSGKAWTPDDFIGDTVYIVEGTGAGYSYAITDNDATSITVAAWTVQPDTTSKYRIVDSVVEFSGWSTLNLQETVEKIGGRTILRARDGTGILQHHWHKDRITIRGEGLVPPAFDSIDFTSFLMLLIHDPNETSARQWIVFGQTPVGDRNVNAARASWSLILEQA